MEIRNLKAEDVPQIVAIYNHHILHTTVVFETEPFDDKKMKKVTDEISATYPYIVAEENGVVAGFAYVHEWKSKPAYKTTVESTVYVREDLKGKGIGTILLRELIKLCRKEGYHAMIACITAENGESMEFHETLGFRQASRFCQVGKKFGRWLDVVDYELIL